MPTKRPFRYKLRLITMGYLHIGSGETLRKNFDYVVHGGRTWVIDNEALAEAILSEGQDSRAWHDLVGGIPASQFLSANDFNSQSSFFRYVMTGEPNSQASGSELQTQIKDPWDRPYIPGSSLKGALRTAFLYAAFREKQPPVRISNMDNNAKFAAQALERELAAPAAIENKGKTPNYDILRAMHVSDSRPYAEPHFSLINAAVVKRSEPGAPIVLEAIPPNTTFEFDLTFDRALLNKLAHGAEELGWDIDAEITWLRQIDTCANILARKRIEAESKRWGDSLPALRDFYKNLAELHWRNEQHKSTFLIQLGWGGGWDSKTFGDHLTQDEGNFAAIVQKYQRFMDRQNNFKLGDPYPKTRRLVLHPGTGQPYQPLGWVQVEMEKL